MAVKRVALLLLICAAGCWSPEADRKRGGDPGADPGNRNAVVEMHQGARPYHDTPCRMTDVKCPDTKIIFGTNRVSES